MVLEILGLITDNLRKQMTKNIFIADDRKSDNIVIYNDESTMVCTANKEDLQALIRLQECRIPGIYILLGDNKRYVGQASNDVTTRLKQHFDNKPWWHKVIFFGREDGHLDKSQMDYLEKKLILEFQELGMDLDNVTSGNQSFISKYSQVNADKTWIIADNILKEIANIDLFQIDSYPEIRDEQVEKNKQIHLSNGMEDFVANNARAAFVSLMTWYINSSKYSEMISELTCDGGPTGNEIIGTKPSYSPGGKEYTAKISDGVYLYANFSKNSIADVLKKIETLTNTTIKKISF